MGTERMRIRRWGAVTAPVVLVTGLNACGSDDAPADGGARLTVDGSTREFGDLLQADATFDVTCAS